jgi:tRNA pseudouridine55 synthase
MPGFILINKPVGPTSHDIVDRVRHMTGVKTVGHAGTLDPFASGLLIVGVGREATREFVKLVGLDKRYRATLHLGATSDTDDRTGRITNGPWTMDHGPIQKTLRDSENGTWSMVRGLYPPLAQPTKETIEQTLKQFTGKIQQLPPIYSAKKIKGKKMYQLARAGLPVARSPSPVEIYSIEIVDHLPQATSHLLTLDIHCSSGTYIRALARDIGETLPAQGGSASGGGCGAYLEELERTAIGPFNLDEAVKADGLNAGNWEKHLISPNQALDRCQRQGGVLGWKQS